MVKVVVVIRRTPGMPRERFLTHWLKDHVDYVRRLPGIRAYRQSPAIEHHKKWPFDGMAELYFDSVSDIARAFDSPEAKELFEHEKLFLVSTEWFIADEGAEVLTGSRLTPGA